MITRKISGTRMSKIVEHNGVIYFAGIVPNDKKFLDVKGQTLDVLAIAEELLFKQILIKKNILRAEIYLKI